MSARQGSLSVSLVILALLTAWLLPDLALAWPPPHHSYGKKPGLGCGGFGPSGLDTDVQPPFSHHSCNAITNTSAISSRRHVVDYIFTCTFTE